MTLTASSSSQSRNAGGPESVWGTTHADLAQPEGSGGSSLTNDAFVLAYSDSEAAGEVAPESTPRRERVDRPDCSKQTRCADERTQAAEEGTGVVELSCLAGHDDFVHRMLRQMS